MNERTNATTRPRRRLIHAFICIHNIWCFFYICIDRKRRCFVHNISVPTSRQLLKSHNCSSFYFRSDRFFSSSLFLISAMLHDVCRSQTPTRTRNPLFRHRLHVSILFLYRSIQNLLIFCFSCSFFWKIKKRSILFLPCGVYLCMIHFSILYCISYL